MYTHARTGALIRGGGGGWVSRVPSNEKGATPILHQSPHKSIELGLQLGFDR